MKQQRNVQAYLCVLGAAVLVGGCAAEYKKKEEAVQKMPVNCATAADDIQTLHKEKANVATQIGLGVSMIAPIGLVTGVATGTEKEKYKVSSGEYNKMIDAKIAEIKSTCNVQ